MKRVQRMIAPLTHKGEAETPDEAFEALKRQGARVTRLHLDVFEDDPEMMASYCATALQQDISSFKLMKTSLRAMSTPRAEALCIYALQIKPKYLKHVPRSLLAYVEAEPFVRVPNILFAALDNDPLTLRFAPRHARTGETHFTRRAVEFEPLALRHVLDPTLELCAAAVRADPRAWEFVPKALAERVAAEVAGDAPSGAVGREGGMTHSGRALETRVEHVVIDEWRDAVLLSAHPEAMTAPSVAPPPDTTAAPPPAAPPPAAPLPAAPPPAAPHALPPSPDRSEGDLPQREVCEVTKTKTNRVRELAQRFQSAAAADAQQKLGGHRKSERHAPRGEIAQVIRGDTRAGEDAAPRAFATREDDTTFSTRNLETLPQAASIPVPPPPPPERAQDKVLNNALPNLHSNTEKQEYLDEVQLGGEISEEDIPPDSRFALQRIDSQSFEDLVHLLGSTFMDPSSSESSESEDEACVNTAPPRSLTSFHVPDVRPAVAMHSPMVDAKASPGTSISRSPHTPQAPRVRAAQARGGRAAGAGPAVRAGPAMPYTPPRSAHTTRQVRRAQGSSVPQRPPTATAVPARGAPVVALHSQNAFPHAHTTQVSSVAAIHSQHACAQAMPAHPALISPAQAQRATPAALPQNMPKVKVSHHGAISARNSFNVPQSGSVSRSAALVGASPAPISSSPLIFPSVPTSTPSTRQRIEMGLDHIDARLRSAASQSPAFPRVHPRGTSDTPHVSRGAATRNARSGTSRSAAIVA